VILPVQIGRSTEDNGTSPAAYSTGALFNEEQECPEGPHLRNGVRGERPALDRGTIRGGKRASNVPKFVAETSGGLPLRPRLPRETCV